MCRFEELAGVFVQPQPAIEIKNLTVSYTDGKPIINNLSLTINKSENILISGHNGSGKTTLLKAILGLIPINSGSITINNNRKGFIAYCGQEKESSSFPISVEEVLNLAIPRDKSKKEIEQIIKKATESTNCETLIKRNFFSLSGGEKQRACIARCLCQEPGIILLDEPFTFLDKDGREELKTILKRLADSEITVLMVTHQNDAKDDYGSWRNIDLNEEEK